MGVIVMNVLHKRYDQQRRYPCVYRVMCDLMDDYIDECNESEDKPLSQVERDRLDDFLHYCNLIVHE